MHQPRRIGITGHASRQTACAFEDVQRAGETVGGQVRRREPGHGGVRAVQLFGVGALAQKLPQAGSLRTGRTERMRHLLGREPQQMAHRGRGRQRAGGAGGVKDLVVRAAQKLTDADADLVAGHRCRQQLTAAAPKCLRHRERRRKHHRRRVEHRAVVHVVLLGHMRRGGVDCRGHQRAGAATVDQHLGRSIARPLRQHDPRDRFHRPRTLAGQRRAEPVEQQVFGAAHHGARHIIKTQRGGKVRELLARCGRGGHRVTP
jgi:hypothetical protein